MNNWDFEVGKDGYFMGYDGDVAAIGIKLAGSLMFIRDHDNP